MKKVSVIVTAYNQADTISQTLDSIMCQECNFPFEIIIGDDFSTDGTREICIDYQKRYPEIIKLLFHKENLGVGANFALSVKQAKGKYIAVCAADDFWHNNNKLQLQVDYLEEKPDCGLLYTDYNKLNIRTGGITKNYLNYSGSPIYVGDGLINKFFIGKVPTLTLTVMFRRELFDKYIPVDDYVILRFPLEDWPTWLILSKYTKLGYLPISTGTYRYGIESISNPISYRRIENKFAKEKIMYKYLCDMFPDDLSYSESEYVRYVNSNLLNLALKKFDYKAARVYALRQKQVGSNKFKIIAAQNWITFYILALLKYLKTIKSQLTIFTICNTTFLN